MPENLVPTPTESHANLVPVDALISEVAALIGQEDEPRTREDALNALIRAGRRLNGLGVWFQARTSQTWTYASSSPDDDEFTDSDQELTLPDDWAWPSEGAMVYDEDGNVLRQPAWAPWHVYRAYTTRNTSSADGVPEILSMESGAASVIKVWPPIDGEQVKRIEIPYYRRVANFSSQDTLFLADEMREALIAGGEYFMAKRYFRDNVQLITVYWQDFQTAAKLAKQADARLQSVFHGAPMPLEIGRAVPYHDPGTTYTVRM